MGKRIPGHERIVREKGYLYYIDSEGYPARAKMKRGGTKKKASKKGTRKKRSMK